MSNQDSKITEIPDPVDVTGNEGAVAVAYVNAAGEVLGHQDIEAGENGTESSKSVESDFNLVQEALTQKSHDLSRQSEDELGGTQLSIGMDSRNIVNPPYPPKCLANFLEVDPVFFRAVKAKVLDSVGRDYRMVPVAPIATDDRSPGPGEITARQFRKDSTEVSLFISTCNDVIPFQGLLERAAMDFESIGWAGLEVIRNRAGRVVGLDHVPAQRLRVLKGWEGFAELRTDSGKAGNHTAGYYTYYQRFGEKFKVWSEDLGRYVRYNPMMHGDIRRQEFNENFFDYQTGEPTNDFDRSANEILYIPKHHSNTIYYGFSDVLPALGAIVGNVHIRDYMLQFFEHNTIPRYAVIVKGAKIDEDFRKMIAEYFGTHVKGAAHKTLILTLQGQSAQQISIEFQKLDSDNKEADFLKTRSENSNQIMTAMGTSPAILGIAEQSELGSGKGLSQAEIYKDRVVGPCQRAWSNALNLLFQSGLGVRYADLKFDPLDIRDRYNEMQTLVGYLDRGASTINEVRKSADIGEALPGGDIPWVRVREGSAFKIEDLDELPSPSEVAAQQNNAPEAAMDESPDCSCEDVTDDTNEDTPEV